MTAPNTPTLELEPVAWAFDRPETPYQFWTTNPEADNLKREKLIPLVRRDEVADAIAKLTAERDKWRDAWMKSAHDEAEAIRERDEAIAERDALKENISVWHSYVREGLGISGEDLPFRFDYYAQEIAAVITANKLLSERVAVLETALEPLKKVADAVFSKRIDGVAVNENCSDDIELFVYADTIITFGDLRRALAAREAK